MQGKRIAALIVALYPDDPASVRWVLRRSIDDRVISIINWHAPIADIASALVLMIDGGKFSKQQVADLVATLENDAHQRIGTLQIALMPNH